MVVGLKKFQEHFAAFADRYALIGGAACDLAFSEVGETFRATKDLDIVLLIERVDAEFAAQFWAFVRSGRYGDCQIDADKRCYYRFSKPTAAGYPAMLELFSRLPDAFAESPTGRLTPVPVDGAVSSLSAILLDDDYYTWICAGRDLMQGVSVVRSEYLIPLKAQAYLDLQARKSAGDAVDSRDLKKHRNDVFRLAQIIDPARRPSPPPAIQRGLTEFFRAVEREEIDLKALGLRGQSAAAVIKMLEAFYKAAE